MGAPFVWFDLTVAAGDEVEGFYRDLFGWTMEPGVGGYRAWMSDGAQPWAGTVATGTVATGTVPAGRWVPYVVVDDLDAAAKRAVDLGGNVVRDRQDGPAGTSVVVADPGGALLALFTPTAPAGG